MAAINRAEAKRYLNAFDFTGFFSELLGWNRPPRTQPLVKQVSGKSFSFTLVAEKKGYAVLLCESVPPHQDRAKLDRLIARDYFEHMLIFADRTAEKQLWQVSLREKGRGVRLREVRLSASGEELLQKLEHIIVPLEREETIHLTDINAGVKAAFDVEKVTKRFFKSFEVEHTQFAKFLKGIPATTKPWYVSVLINRLMFLYFMQAKSFLNGDLNYLSTKLEESQRLAKDAFYRDFLCPLFFQGFALKESDRPKAIKQLLGDIPYLNGGLFQPHPLEIEHGEAITIPDAAFERLFAFFGKWTWHLDQRSSADGDEIDPDVLGYIFEKYINQKQMGAYYTKEDITGYITQNTVLPFLLDTARKDCENAFKPEGVVWRLISERPDRYIYEPMRRGNQTSSKTGRLELPSDIAQGLEAVNLRAGWNRPVPGEFESHVLPTETWREFVGRRARYDALLSHLEAGGITTVEDLIVQNLDIRQLTLDVIQYAGSEDLVESIYKAIEKVTILDPTCGSGAFLFAALELLQPLYDACLSRMSDFVDEEYTDKGVQDDEPRFNRFAHFRQTLAAAEKHINREYFVLKTIIVNNLYGVDLMEEATEICKLRLFLKLVAQIESKDKHRIEPLPDIDFNIRAGNALVGFARYEEVKEAASAKFAFDDSMARIDERLMSLDKAVGDFRRQQTVFGGSVSVKDKQSLQSKFSDLDDELDDFLSADFGVKPAGLAKWRLNYKPFHWFSAFHGILTDGGFDVVIGNPPYVEYKDVLKKSSYTLQLDRFRTKDCGNLYAYSFERALSLVHRGSRTGLIIPVASISTDGYESLRNLLQSRGEMVISSFNDRPAKLFDGLEHIRLSIILHHAGATGMTQTSSYMKWSKAERDTLFGQLAFGPARVIPNGSFVPKVGDSIGASIIAKLYRDDRLPLSASFSKTGNGEVIYTRKLSHFVQILDFVPSMTVDGIERDPSELKVIRFPDKRTAGCALSVLNSSLFYWLLNVTSDCRNLNRREIDHFPISLSDVAQDTREHLFELSKELSSNLKQNSKIVDMDFEKHGKMRIQCIYPRHAKDVIDAIDVELAKHYGFTDKELDFVVNFDVKYRMGADDSEQLSAN